MQEYNEIMGNNGFSMDQAHLCFINAFSTVHELASICTQELISSKAMKKPSFQYSYEEYIELATDMCDTLDEQQKLHNSRCRVKLHVLTNHDDITSGDYIINNMDITDGNDDMEFDEGAED